MTGAGDDWVVEEPDEPLEPEEVVPPEGVLEDVIGAVAAAVVACAMVAGALAAAESRLRVGRPGGRHACSE